MSSAYGTWHAAFSMLHLEGVYIFNFIIDEDAVSGPRWASDPDLPIAKSLNLTQELQQSQLRCIIALRSWL